MGMYKVIAKVQMEVEIMASGSEVKSEEQAKDKAREIIRSTIARDVKKQYLLAKDPAPICSDSWEVERVRKR